MRIKPVNQFIKFISGLVFGKITGISLCPFGIYMDHPADAVTLNHEKIHWHQQTEMLILPFYIWYLAEFLIRRIFQSKKEAYISISFEKEAYAHQDDPGYLKTRKPYSWIKRSCTTS
jgi:hypothetical protein